MAEVRLLSYPVTSIVDLVPVPEVVISELVDEVVEAVRSLNFNAEVYAVPLAWATLIATCPDLISVLAVLADASRTAPPAITSIDES